MFNVRRPLKAPVTLLAQQRYDGHDVYEALAEMFFDKCYICESKEPSDINVEHFKPHLGDASKKFDWNNLYLSCSRCNNIKRADFDDILDCCDSSIDVSRAIKLSPPLSPYARSISITVELGSERAESTSRLLNKVFNSEHTINKRMTAASLRRRVFEQYSILQKQMEQYFSPVATEGDKLNAIEKMKILIDRSSPYSAFIRWCILEDDKLAGLLEEFMD